MKWIGIAVCLLLASGCMNINRKVADTALPNNVTTKAHLFDFSTLSTGARYLDTVSFYHQGISHDSDLKQCIVLNVHNLSYRISGASMESETQNTRYGPITHFVPVPESSFVGGGQVLLKQQPDFLMASGIDRQGNSLLSYVLELSRKEDSIQLLFRTLDAGVINAGGVENPGLVSVPAWKEADPMGIYYRLKRLDEKIASCLTATDTVIRKAQ